MFASIINLLYPAFCQLCGKKSKLWNNPICANCLSKLKKRLPPFCTSCGRQMQGSPELAEKCGDCKESLPYFDKAFSVFYYNEPLRKLIHDIKYKKITSMVSTFKNLTVEFIKQYNIAEGVELSLSIPMHPVRLFKREINPSDMLGKAFAQGMGIAYSDKILKKTKNTSPQSKLTREKRILNLKGSFSVRKPLAYQIRNKNILLIDDIFTTGSTANECAKILKEKGAKYIKVLTLARGDKTP